MTSFGNSAGNSPGNSPGNRPGALAGRAVASAPVYRRRRIMVLAALAALTVAVFAALAPVQSQATPSAPPVTVVVGAGDTVWDLVVPHVPAGEDPRAYVAEVAAFNGIRPSALTPGAVLRLPRR